jgi:hypothetical protein
MSRAQAPAGHAFPAPPGHAPRQPAACLRRVAAAFVLLATGAVHAGGLLGATALQARHAATATPLAQSPFGRPLVLDSIETGRRIDGEVYAVLDRPFDQVAGALGDASRWCDILILHLNTKGCTEKPLPGGSATVSLHVGKKVPQSLEAAQKLTFAWRVAARSADYLAVRMDAPDGPYDTREYLLVAEAMPLQGGRTFLHMGYGFSYGAFSHLAMHAYLGTVGRDKVGFTRPRAPSADDEGFVDGMRGVAERNTMRYFLAIDAYLAAPQERQFEQRLAGWFDSTERYPRQLHEVERADYLRMKRDEVRRQRLAQ